MLKNKLFGVISLGCDKNRVDTEKLLGLLKEKGCKTTNELDKAQILIINTCAFLQSSREEAIETILNCAEYKDGNLEKIVVTGCLPQKFIDELYLPLQEADIFLGISDYESIFDLFHKIDYYAEQFDEEAISHIAKNIVEEIYCNLAISGTKPRDATVNQLVDQAIAYINENLTTIRGIEEICDSLYISKSHLHHLFIKNIHISPKQYIISKRLMKARRLIRHGKKPTEIYSECGFDDYTTFFRNYTKHFGYSPSEENKAITRTEVLS